jgi:alpha-beta hydrolase superfamily lysophospholipase
MRAFSALTVATALLACAPEKPDPEASEVEAVGLRTADGVVVHATRYAAERPRAVVLLFHQANSSAGEYATIAPRLAAVGLEALAVDQRSGGDLYGPNRTVARIGTSAAFIAAEPDLEAAFAWGRGRKLPVILWGSSYSAALVFRLAARHPGEVTAVIAFSPGEYLEDSGAVSRAAAEVRAPIFVAAASDPAEQAAARAILAAAPAAVEVAYLPASGGIHGASTLNAERNPAGNTAAWTAVESFLRDLP